MKKLFSAMLRGGSSITIDGKTFSGRNVQIVNDRVIIDGVEQDGSLVGPIHIEVNGSVDHMETGAGSVEVSGSCGTVKTVSGDVICGDVGGNVSTISGDVTCGSVSGGVKTMSGDVRYK